MVQYAVGIKNLEVTSPVGIDADERALKVRLSVSVDLSFANVGHLPISLHATFDYARLAAIVTEVCAQPHNLLEQIAVGVMAKLQPILHEPCDVHLRIEKKNPIADLSMDGAYVDVSEKLLPGKHGR